ncbi:unnamed protein product [Caenorhabditis angaria]|uniref:Ribosomal RNA-processing protein 8 n=1 Tax=Caenorhabditis angaria TaxID=860376 RepID=A0A9P1N6P6_9PELO|nr:unnamed protein product [Caenorhabditis angaria]
MTANTDVTEKKKKRPWRNKLAEIEKKKRGPKKKKYRAENENIQKNGENLEEEEELDAIGEAKKKLDSGRFRFLNEKLYTCTGSEAYDFFKQDPTSFQCYHKGFADQVKKWPNHPLREIIQWLQKKSEKLSVFDLGCGEAKIAEAVGDKHNVRSFDLVAVNDRVESCDMSKLPAEDGSADIVIFCLSLMGTNLYDFVREARRVLKIGGILKIAEVSSRFVSVKMFCEAISKMGFEMSNRRDLTDYFIMFEFRKIAKIEKSKPFGLKLKPCLYKKR